LPYVEAISRLTASRDEDTLAKIRRCVAQGHIDPEDFNGARIPLQIRRSRSLTG
jgi:hypothetical protein